MAVLFSGTIAANSTQSVTVVANTIVGIETSKAIHIKAANGSLIATSLDLDAINIIPTATTLHLTTGPGASTVTVNGQ
jgi:hypothetical protein